MNTLSAAETKDLALIANRLREHVIRMIAMAGSGHPGGALGLAELMTALYFRILRHDPKNPDWPERDRFVLSNGHVCPVRYAAMAEAGYLPVEELLTLRKFGSRLQGHPERERLPGLETSSGPLGAGLAQAAGLAYAARLDGASWRTYCLTSDGEQDCGLNWEAVMFAGARRLANLTLFIDRNHIQLDGPTEEIMPLDPLADKYRAFNWNVLEADGHDFGVILNAVESSRLTTDRPTVIICRTVPGKGVSFMENDYRWHGQAPDTEQAEKALAEIATREREIKEGSV